jgi:hypothetical protein
VEIQPSFSENKGSAHSKARLSNRKSPPISFFFLPLDQKQSGIRQTKALLADFLMQNNPYLRHKANIR